MLNELLVRNGMTVGSYTVVTMPIQTGDIPPTSLVSDGLPSHAEAEQTPPPVQSAGSSALSGGLQKKLYSALADFADLASHWLWRLWFVSSPEVWAANMDPWTAKNQRRIRLIEKKHCKGLDAAESEELARLKREVSTHLQQVAPRSTDVIDEFEEHIRKLKENAATKRRKSS